MPDSSHNRIQDRIPNLSAWAVQHPAFVLYLILACIVAGTYAYFNMGRAEDPTFTFKAMVVRAFWPGATAAEMELQIAEPIEKRLQDLPYFELTRTFTRPGLAVVMLQLEETIRPEQVTDIWYQARKKISDISHAFPTGVQGPFFDDEFGDVYSAVYAMTGEGYQLADLEKLAEAAKMQFLKVPGVDKVALVGDRPEKIFVEFSHTKLATLGISPQTIFDSLARQNAMAPAGSVDTATDRVYVRVTGTFDAAEQVRQVPVAAAGRVFRLGDLAEVKRDYEDPPIYTMRHNGQPAVGVAVCMSKGQDILKFGESLEAESAKIRTDLPIGAEMHTVNFQPLVVAQSVTEFLRAFAEALVIVMAVSFLSLGFRSGVVVALCVPLVLAIVFVVMNLSGMNFDRITLGAMIVALGLLVDDAIIAIEMMIVKMEQGWDRMRAASFAWTSTAWPMLTGTLITAAGFLPVGLARSSSGEYAGNIFWVVGLALIVSWIVAVLFTPYLGVKLLPSYAHKHHLEAYQSWFHRALRVMITSAVRHPWAVVLATCMLFASAIVLFSNVPQQFFPSSSRPELMVDLRLPEGSSFRATEAEVQKLEELLAEDPDITMYTAYTGAGSPRFFLSLIQPLSSPNCAQIIVQTPGIEARERVLARYISLFDSDQAFPGLRGRITRLPFGPPVEFPVQFRVVGDDTSKVREISYKVCDVMSQHPDIRNAHLNWGERSKTVRLELDQDRARALGLAPQDIAETMQTLLSGIPVSQYREGTELIDVVARAVPEERLTLESIPDLSLPTPSGRAVPLGQVATLRYELEDPILWRRSRETVLTVQSDIREGTQPVDVTNKILALLEPIRRELPSGYRIDTGGAVEESGKANNALFAIFPAMILVMWTLLMMQTQSFKKSALVFGIAPLGMIGATYAMLIFDAPFGFVALLGLISLAGMDMRNSLILIDQIDRDIENGLSEWDAVIESAVRRSRPVLLTAATAILAMIPLTRSVFWGPMAIAIMGGLAIATFLTLLNLPALYVILLRVRPSVLSEHADSPSATESSQLNVPPSGVPMAVGDA